MNDRGAPPGAGCHQGAGGGWDLGLAWETRRSWKLLRGQGQALIVEGQEALGETLVQAFLPLSPILG